MSSGAADLRLVLSGLPAAGKTTFLAALWQVFETDGFESALTLDSYVGDQRYIVELNRAWANCQELERTALQRPGMVRVRLCDPDSDVVELEVPDLSGEVFRDHWVDRRWDRDFDQRVQSADGIVLMASTLAKDPLLISEVQAREATLAEAMNGENPDSEGEVSPIDADTAKEANGAATGPREWDPRESPQQVQLVEHLQFVASRRDQQPIPVVTVLSAWDQVRAADEEASPATWLARRLPLLDQYLRANEDRFPSTAYGVSAQGGDLEDDRERLLALRPIERLDVTDGRERGHDLTLPLAWLAKAAKE